MLISDTTLSTSRFISPSVTKANRSPILTLILIVNKTRLAVFEIGEYHLGNTVGYSSVLAGADIRSREAFRPIARERKYLMDYNCGIFFNMRSKIYAKLDKRHESIKRPLFWPVVLRVAALLAVLRQ